MITPQQKAHFYDFGFIRLRQQFSADEMEALGREVDEMLAEQRGGGPPGENQGMADIIEKSPVATRMLVDDRIFGTVEELLGPRFVWNGSGGSLSYTGVNGKGEHRWHSDRPADPHATTYSFHLYLEKLRGDNGALRVIPGSHRPSLYDNLLPLSEDVEDGAEKVYGLSPTDLPGVVVESDPGDIVFFTQKIYHGVYGMQPGRRYLKLRFAAWPETDEQIASFMRYDHRGSIYDPVEPFTSSDNPRIRAMIDPLAELKARTEAQREHFDALGARTTYLELFEAAIAQYERVYV